MTRPLVVLDGNALAYRAYHALLKTNLRTGRGEPTWAIYGFVRTLIEVVQSRKPGWFAVAFDSRKPTFRHQLYTGYKAQRPPMPEEMRSQMRIIRHFVRLWGFPFLELDHFEADDAMGTLARQANVQGVPAIIVSGDQDTLQLVSPLTRVLMPHKGTPDWHQYDEAMVRNRYGVTVGQFVDYKALIGDSSDNIPGVPGIGPEKAKVLLQQWGSVQAALDDLDSVQPPLTAKALRNNPELFYLSHKLSAISTSAPVSFDVGQMRTAPPADPVKLEELFDRLNFGHLKRSLGKTVALFEELANA